MLAIGSGAACWRYLILLVILIPAFANASVENFSSAIRAATLSELANELTWLRLLHYDSAGSKSEIISEDFFLAPNGQQNPYAELQATLDAYQQPWTDNSDLHPRCRFPARYYWLNAQLGLPDYQLRDKRCRRFEEWALLDKIDSISLLLVSGFYGNPASTFGHALVKLNTSGESARGDLFDLTVNFGAMVPPNEPILLYVGRGLTGGYEAAFSDRYYYAQDMVYTRTEFRDIWDYRLNLDNSQRTLLLLHLWEVMGKRFVYYFLSDNCASRLSELLELVTGERFLEHSALWYTPIETFHRLDEIDQQRKDSSLPTLVEQVRFIPSGQRNLYTQVNQLEEQDRSILNNIIRNGPDTIETHLLDVPPERQISISNALLAYYQYRITAEQPEPSEELETGKNRTLYKRLTLPVKPADTTPTQPLKSPAESAPPLQTAFGAGTMEDGSGYLQLRYTPYSYEKLSRDSHDNDEMVVLSTTLGVDDQNRAFLENFDMIRIRALHTENIPIEGEGRLSWQLRVGADRLYNGTDYRYDTSAAFGAGHALALGKHTTVYAMIDLAAHSYPEGTAVEPNLGGNFTYGRLRSDFTYRYSLNPALDEATTRSRFRLQLQLTKAEAFRFELSQQHGNRASISYLHYW